LDWSQQSTPFLQDFETAQNKPVNMKTNHWIDPLEVQTAIKRKFRTIRNFCDASGIKYHVMTNAITGRLSSPRSQDVLNKAKQQIAECELLPCVWCIDNEQREFVKNAVKTRFGTLQNFCKIHPEFTLTFVHNVIAGKRKRVDDRVLALIDILNQTT
jgi:hypothetical protein